MKNLLTRFYYKYFVKFYVFLFGRKFLDKFNLRLFQLILRTRGFGNYENFRISGEEEFLRELCQTKPKFCIDVGANVGTYSKIILENTDAKVIAFEPLPETFEILRNLQNEYGNRFTAVQKGLSDSPREMDLFYGPDNLQLATLSESVNEISYVREINQQRLRIQVDTLDNFYLQNLKDTCTSCDLLKIDTEGFEYEVLKGAQYFITELKPKYIQIEFNLHHLYRNHTLKCFGQLLRNYSCYQILPNKQGLIFRDINQFETNIFSFSNFVFIRNV